MDGKLAGGQISNLYEATISIGQNQYRYDEFYAQLMQVQKETSLPIPDEKIEKNEQMPLTPYTPGKGSRLDRNENGSLEIQEVQTEDKAETEPKEAGQQKGENASQSKEETGKNDLDSSKTEEEGEPGEGDRAGSGRGV